MFEAVACLPIKSASSSSDRVDLPLRRTGRLAANLLALDNVDDV